MTDDAEWFPLDREIADAMGKPEYDEETGTYFYPLLREMRELIPGDAPLRVWMAVLRAKIEEKNRSS